MHFWNFFSLEPVLKTASLKNVTISMLKMSSENAVLDIGGITAKQLKLNWGLGSSEVPRRSPLSQTIGSTIFALEDSPNRTFRSTYPTIVAVQLSANPYKVSSDDGKMENAVFAIEGNLGSPFTCGIKLTNPQLQLNKEQSLK